MTARAPIADVLAPGRIVLLGGACGTECLRRGVATPLPLWSAQALLDAPTPGPVSNPRTTAFDIGLGDLASTSIMPLPGKNDNGSGVMQAPAAPGSGSTPTGGCLSDYHFLECVADPDMRCLADGWSGVEVVKALAAADSSWRSGGLPVTLEARRSVA